MSQLTATVEIGHPSEVALLERYALMLREVRALAEATSMDQLIDVCEMSIIEKGREVSRSSLEEMVQERIDAVEKKGVATVRMWRVERESWFGESDAPELPGRVNAEATVVSMSSA